MQPLDFLDLGIAVIPVHYQTKRPAVLWAQYQTTLPSRSEVMTWLRPGHKSNFAVICGWQNLVVLDFDTLAGYDHWRLWAATKPLAASVAAQTYQVSSSRGKHVYVLCDERPRSGHFNGGDTKGLGGYVLIPPSVHPNGTQYVSDELDAPILRVSRLADVLPDPPRVSPAPPLPLTNVASAASLWPLTVVEKIKEAVRIEILVPEARPHGSGRWWTCRCPLHDDRAPSFRIDVDKQLAVCWSGCHAGKAMDCIALYAELHRITDRQAIKELAQQIGV